MHLKISGQVLYVQDSRPTEGEKKWPLILSRTFPCFLRLLHNAYTYSVPLRLLPYAYMFCVYRYCGTARVDSSLTRTRSVSVGIAEMHVLTPPLRVHVLCLSVLRKCTCWLLPYAYTFCVCRYCGVVSSWFMHGTTSNTNHLLNILWWTAPFMSTSQHMTLRIL
jgi:hypothetical protein